jgi:hypothetical protein
MVSNDCGSTKVSLDGGELARREDRTSNPRIPFLREICDCSLETAVPGFVNERVPSEECSEVLEERCRMGRGCEWGVSGRR